MSGALEVEYVDNVPCIDLVSSLRTGLLAALDAECAARSEPEHYVARIKNAHRSLFDLYSLVLLYLSTVG